MNAPKKISDYTPTTNLDGTEALIYAKSGTNGSLTLATLNKRGTPAITIGRPGSGAQYECDGVDDHVQIQAAIDLAATGNNSSPSTIYIIGYGYAFQYNIGATIVIKATTGGPGIHLIGDNTVLKMQNGFAGDMFITQNFYSEINSNYNSYSTIGDFVMKGFTLEGNSQNSPSHTTTYASAGNFPTAGATGKLYVARDTDTGYTWNGSAYVTTAIVNNGLHWRAYAYHLIKMYAFHSILEDIYVRDASEFGIYSEQTNTDTNVFNNYATMETIWRHISMVGYQLGAINWLGPHDGHWYDVGPHTNEYSAPTVLYNIAILNGNNYNGGGLVVNNFHPWANVATYGCNLLLKNTSIRGDAYVEGATIGTSGIRAINSTFQLELVTTNCTVGIELTNCYNVALTIDNYYQFVSLVKMVKIVGTLTNSQIVVRNVDNNNLSGTPQIFDFSTATTLSNCYFYARIPYTNPVIDPGINLANPIFDATNEIDIVRMGQTPANLLVIKRTKGSSAIVSTKTANYTINGGDETIVSDATAASRTITLPTAVGYNGPSFLIKRLDATFTSANTVTVATTSSQTIDGATTVSLTTQGQGIRVVSNGTNWIITARV